MAPIVIERILSVSSEDVNNPAENLLKTNYSGKKWKCKTAGEKQISVLLQFKNPSIISSIDVGNEHSAFIEILVGKSTSLENDFKVLVVTSTLMGLQDSKYSSNTNAVRFFKQNDLLEEVRNERWDRVKVICSQPFNKHVQYGLSFIIFHSEVGQDMQTKPETSTAQLSIIDSTSETPAFAPGSLFARQKKLAEDTPKAGAAAVRAAVATLEPQGITFSKAKPKPATAVQPAGNMKTPNGLKPKTPTRRPSPAKKIKKPSRKTKPFSSLFDDVVFAISGFVNPLRGEIRNKAVAMGAKYKADWERTCTHLICAFSNTPKYREVKGKGKIVKKEWIETSYDKRTRFPWRRFALDINDSSLPESDEEIFDCPSPSARTIDNRKRVHSTESEDDTDDESQKVLQKRRGLKLDLDENQPSTSTARQQPCPKVVDNDPVDNPIVKLKAEEDEMPSSSKDEENNGIYDVDTDVEEDFNNAILQSRKLPYLPEFFDEVSFYICEDFSESVKKQLQRYILAHKGTLVESISDDVEFVIADSLDTIKEIKEESPQIVAVRPEWVWRSHDENRVFPTSEFEL